KEGSHRARRMGYRARSSSSSRVQPGLAINGLISPLPEPAEPLFREAKRVFGRPKDRDGVAVQFRKGPCPMLPSLATDHHPLVSIARRSNGVRSFLFVQPRGLTTPGAGC